MPNAHARFKHRINCFQHELAQYSESSMRLLIDRFVVIYTMYLTKVDEKLKPSNCDRLSRLGMHPIYLKASGTTILNTMAMCVYRNPSRHRDVGQLLGRSTGWLAP
ncbi:hypothetical protein GJ496_010039 [Pomphorhynchus laevis]|nr:hypothetical protein GJ496_010039 [Pomphorhynchus laevis]